MCKTQARATTLETQRNEFSGSCLRSGKQAATADVRAPHGGETLDNGKKQSPLCRGCEEVDGLAVAAVGIEIQIKVCMFFAVANKLAVQIRGPQNWKLAVHSHSLLFAVRPFFSMPVCEA